MGLLLLLKLTHKNMHFHPAEARHFQCLRGSPKILCTAYETVTNTIEFIQKSSGAALPDTIGFVIRAGVVQIYRLFVFTPSGHQMGRCWLNENMSKQ